MAKTKKKVKKKVVKKAVRKVGKGSVSVISEKPEESASVEPKITLYPQAGAKVQEFEDVLDRQLAGDTEPPTPKRGPGRPPKPPEPEPPELTIDVVAGVVKIPFELWSISQSVKSLALTDEEAKRIAEPAKQLLEYYLPQIPVIAYAWISLSVSTFWVMQTRLRTIKEIREHRKRLEQPRPTEPAQPGVVTSFPAEIKTNKV